MSNGIWVRQRPAGPPIRPVRTLRRAAWLALAAALACPAAAFAQRALSPPPSYLLRYTNQLGVPGDPAGAAVTPTGNVYTGWAELDLEVGARKVFRADSWTLDNGRVPILRAFRADQGTLYTLTLFEASALGHPYVHVHIDVKNLRPRANQARVTAAIRYDSAELTPRTRSCCIRVYRFPRPRTPPRDGLYFQPGEGFKHTWRYDFAGPGVLTRNGQAVLFYPAAGSARVVRILHDPGRPDQKTFYGRALYNLRLPRFGRRSFDFRMPVAPVSPGTRQFGAIARARFGAFRGQVRQYYNRLFGASMGISLPERKVTDTFYASLANMALSRYRSPHGIAQTVNKMRYHSFWLRDGAVITNAFDKVGLYGIAAQNLNYFYSWQQPDGLFISRPQEWDGFGQALWALGEHYRFTRSRAFAQQAFPAVSRAMSWFGSQRAADGRRLMPPVRGGTDNDLVSGHLSGDNFWAAAGVAGAIDIARGAGNLGAATSWSGVLADFKATLRRHIAARAPRGPIPPSLDRPGGQVWGILWASYIGDVYPATSPVVQNTIRRARRLFSEGIMTYLSHRLLHHYSGFRVWQTELLANQQRNVVRGLYSTLAHTTSTNAGWEAAVMPFSDRVVDDATTPHGWFAAEYVSLLRNMLVREQGRDVYLMSAVSPSWLRPGRRITVRRAPTHFGRVSFQLRGTGGGAVLTWSSNLRPGTRLVWPVPYAARGVSARGRRGPLIVLPGRSGRLSVRWSLIGENPTFQQAYDRLMRAYVRSDHGATAHEAGADRREVFDPGDLDSYVPLTPAGRR
jgi:hypothetical protein